MPKTINIAFMAHVDAGKTTLTEQILYQSGVIRMLGSVDEGTAKTDDLAVERARGISVRAALASFKVGEATVNLIDTPGHADFYSQVERTFLAVDAVVVLVSAVDGVQAGTETIVSEANENHIPVIFFVNKCDRDTARAEETAEQIKELRIGAFDYAAQRYETAALYDDVLTEAFLDGAAEDVAAVNKTIRDKIKACELSPILFGSAYTGEGVAQLLDAIGEIAPYADSDSEGEPRSGVVFSVMHDKAFGRGAYIRLFTGSLQARDVVCINGVEYKTTVMRRNTDGRLTDVKELCAGEIGLVYGLSGCKTGDMFGDTTLLPPRAAKGLEKKALLTAQIRAENTADSTVLRAVLEMMTAEDPTLEYTWESATSKIHINVMGAVQIETLSAIIEERFGIKVLITEPEIIYKETLSSPAIGFDAYTMPKPSWAILKFSLTPAKRGSGVTYKCTAPPNRISYRYREQVETSIVPSLKQGLYGWQVTDVDIDLIDGEDHPVHTHPLDFTIAAPLALMNGLKNGGTTLLEPILEVKFTCNAKHIGRIMSDVTAMRGKVGTLTHRGEDVTLSAEVPLASSLNYPVTFASITSGLGVMVQKLRGYKECPLDMGKTRARMGINPLDREKYILAARGAMGGTVFD